VLTCAFEIISAVFKKFEEQYMYTISHFTINLVLKIFISAVLMEKVIQNECS
jgi:hypothetical protein